MLHVVKNLYVLPNLTINTALIHLFVQYYEHIRIQTGPEKMAAEMVERTWWATNCRACPEDCIVIALHSLLLSKNFTCVSLSDEVSLVLFRNADACDVIIATVYMLVHRWSFECMLQGSLLYIGGAIPALVVCCMQRHTLISTTVPQCLCVLDMHSYCALNNTHVGSCIV